MAEMRTAQDILDTFHKGYAKAAADILEQVDQEKHGWREYQPSWLVGFEKARDVVAQISHDAQQDVPSASELLYEANNELDGYLEIPWANRDPQTRRTHLKRIRDIYNEAYNRLNEELEAEDDDVPHWNPSDPPLDENLAEEV